MKYIRTLLILLFSTPAFAVDPGLNWQTIATDNFEIHFAQGSEALAYKAADIAERVHARLSPRLNWQPLEKTHLVLSDETDQPNGYAIPFPINRSVLFLSPPDSANSLEDFNDWLELLITHEYTHVLHLDKVSGGPESLREIFGRHFLLFPNMFQPGWFTEGLATHYETNSAQGIGRGQSSLFSMMMRMEVVQGIKPVSQVNLPIRSWPMGTSYYLYGVHFYDFLSEAYGEEAVSALVANYSNNIIPFAINTNSNQLFNKDITQLWAEFDIWLQQKYQPQIQQLQNLVTGEAITDDGYFTSEPSIAADGTVFYIRSGAFDHSMLMMIDAQGTHREITKVHNDARIDVNDQHDVLIAQPEVCRGYNLYSDLYLWKSTAHKLQRLTNCGRYRSASWLNKNTVIAVHIENSISSLHIIDLLTNQKNSIWQGDATTVIGQPDISADGLTLAAAVFRKNHGWNIELFNLRDRVWQKLTDDPVIDMYPRFISDGSALLFSSERNNVYNIYRYDFSTQTISALTHVLSGAFQPAQQNSNAALYYTGYSGHGSDIYKLQSPLALSNESLPPLPITTEPASVENYPGLPANAYSPWSSLAPRWWHPSVVLNEDQSEFGFTTAGNDALGIHNYALSLAWDSTNSWGTGSFAYAWSNLFFLGVERTTDILLNSNNQFAVARQNDDAFVIANFPRIQVESIWNLAVATIRRHTSDARRDPILVPSPRPDTDDSLFGLAASFSNSKDYIRSISANDGRTVHVIAESSDVFHSDYSGEIYTFDWREYLPLGGQHVLALRVVEGYGTDQPEPFRLGGENSDFQLLDLITGSSNIAFGEREYSLRGYAEGHSKLTGRRMQLATAEWRFPLALVERGLMAPPIAIMQLSGSVFAESGRAWQDTAGNAYSSIGAELHGDISLFYGLALKMRLGVAKGLDADIGDERMYLSLGSTF